MLIAPPIKANPYNQELRGFYGEFGTGSNTQIFFLQTGLTPAQLKKVALISEIRGSEAWPVKDLFQREVDEKRVTNRLLPYFRAPDKVKFFNPITLTVLPIDPQTNLVLPDMPALQPFVMKEDGQEWRAVECPGYFRFRYISDNPQYGVAEWNDARVSVVAIDGQHRLSALKRYFADPGLAQDDGGFLGWTVPVVLFGLRALIDDAHKRTILDVVRSIFIYINTEAKAPNDARQILLSDESINAVAAQELLQYSHENDLRESECDVSKVPLLFYDWRGLEEDLVPLPTPGALKSVVEVGLWLENYILGENFSPGQQVALDVQPLDALNKVFVDRRLGPEQIDECRKVIRSTILPGLTYFVENFRPYRKYIATLRALEAEFTSKSDVARHAFYELRFGSNQAGPAQQRAIRELVEELTQRIADINEGLPALLEHDIGMRGVMSAFGALRPAFRNAAVDGATWRDYSVWFTDAMNDAFDADWFAEVGEKSELRLHVSVDHNGMVANYRVGQVHDALGALVVAVVCAHGAKAIAIKKPKFLVEAQQSALDALYNTILRGYRKQVRVLLKDKYGNQPAELKKQINEQANKRSDEHAERLAKALAAI